MDRPDVMPPLYTSGTVGLMLLASFARHATRPALADDRKRWTYGETAQAVARMIAVLKGLGLKRGDGLCVLSANRVEAFATGAAALLMGVRYTPLHPLAGEEDHVAIVEDCEAKALIVDGVAFGPRGRAIKAALPALTLLSLDACEGATDLLAACETVEPAPLVDEADGGDISYLSYTGGTTGRSKGVMISHRAFVYAALLQASDWDWPTEIRFLAATPITHSAGAALYAIVLRGGFVRLLPGFEPERFCRTVAEERITATLLVPTMIYVLLDHPARRSHDLSSLQTIVYGAAPMSPDRLKEAIGVFGQVFVQLYGQTEAPQCITTLRKVDHDVARPERLGGCGYPVPGLEVKLLDADLNEVPVGQPGEICVRGPLVMSGYWKRPDATAEAFRGGWLHTGDVAVREADGFMTIVDRTKDMIVTGGFNVYPREVEDALLSHPAVASAAVIGVPDEKWGEAVKAFVVLKGEADEAALKAWVKDRRGSVWTPKSVEIVDSVPLTAIGKVDRKALRAKYWEGRGRGVA